MKDKKDIILESLEGLSNEKMDLVLNYIIKLGDNQPDPQEFKLKAMAQIQQALKSKKVLV